MLRTEDLATATGAADEIREDLEAGRRGCPIPRRPLSPEAIEGLDRLFRDFCQGALDGNADRC